MVSTSLIWVSERESMDNPSETTEVEGKLMLSRPEGSRCIFGVSPLAPRPFWLWRHECYGEALREIAR